MKERGRKDGGRARGKEKKRNKEVSSQMNK